jgi:hypothetical protein
MSDVDFAVAVGTFFAFISVLIIYLTSYMSSYIGLTSTSELRTVAYDYFNGLFTGKGIPSNWEQYTFTPVKVGLTNDLYRIPIVVTETNGTFRNNITINVSVSFDPSCQNKTWNSSVRIYNESNYQFTSTLYNQSFCVSQYLNSSDIAFNLSLGPREAKKFFIYYSPDQQIISSNYTIEFPVNATNYTAVVYPEEKFTAISVSKMKSLRNRTYYEVARTLGLIYQFNVEVSS